MTPRQRTPKTATIPQLPPDQLAAALSRLALRHALADNVAELRELFRDCADLSWHDLLPRRGPRACLIYVEGLVDRDLVERDILQPLLHGEITTDLEQVGAGVTPLSQARVLSTLGEVVDRVLAGSAILLVDGAAAALAYGVPGWQSRSVEEPITEASIRGSREGFLESLRLNTALLRRRIRSPALKLVAMQIGRITRTDVMVTYIQGLADPGVVAEVFRRLERIDTDAILESGYLEEFIRDSPFSPFPQIQNSERPDTVAGQLLEGRVGIFVDGTPFVLIVPAGFNQFVQSAEDYYELYIYATAVRVLRHLFLALALLMPSVWIAIISFHQEMLPTPLLLSVSAAHEGVPFPALVEVVLMEITFEILREAGIRLPRPVGQAVSFVGALVIGEASVRAGLVSAPTVVVVAITGIASLALPRYHAAITVRMVRFLLMVLAGTLGMFGIAAALGAILLHLCSLRSFGVPYLAPVAPLHWSGLKDTLVRSPHWLMTRRPPEVAHANRLRTPPGQRPGPQRGRGRRG